MRHGLMMRTLAAALLSLVVGAAAQAGGKDKDCNGCTTTPVIVRGVGTTADCGDCGPRVKKGLGSHLNGTGCCDSNFIFGPSKCYFKPCNPGCSDLPISVFHPGFNRANCPLPVYGPGIGCPANSCGVFSNLNR